MADLRGFCPVSVGQTGVRDVEVIQVVRTRLSRRGEGIEGDPIRAITEYWSLDGELLAEVDEWARSEPIMREALEGPADA